MVNLKEYTHKDCLLIKWGDEEKIVKLYGGLENDYLSDRKTLKIQFLGEIHPITIKKKDIIKIIKNCKWVSIKKIYYNNSQ